MLARLVLLRGAGLGEFPPRPRGLRPRPLQPQGQFVARRERLQRGLGRLLAFDRLVARAPRPRERLVQRRQPRQRLRAAPLGRGEPVARGVARGAQRAGALARGGFRVGRLAHRGLGARRLRLGRLGRLPRRLRLAREIAQAVLLGEAPGGGRRRFGGRDEIRPNARGRPSLDTSR